MPPLALASLLQQALPWLSPDGRAAIGTLICWNGRVGSAQALGERLGLRTRYQLGRLLRCEGLPPYEELAGWICVLHWLLTIEREPGVSLRSLARQAGMSTENSYRLVRRITGQRWKDLRVAGSREVIRWFVRRTTPARLPHAYAATRRSQPSPALAPTVVDQASSDRPYRMALPGAPYGIAVRDRDLAYITRTEAAAIACLDLQTGRLVGSIALGCGPSCVVFDPTGARAYVSVHYHDEIAIIDAERHVPIGAFHVPGDPVPLALSSRGQTLFVSTNEDRLFALNAGSGRIIGSLRLPATSHHLALHPAGDRLYVATRAGGTVLEIDTTRLRVQRTFELGGWPQGLVIAPDGATLYAANEQHGLDVVTLGNGRQGRIPIAGGAVSLALSADGFLYTGLVHAGTVGVIAAAQLRLCSSIATGGRPRQIAFDARNRVLIVNEGGWVDVLPSGMDRIPSADQREAPAPALRSAS